VGKSDELVQTVGKLLVGLLVITTIAVTPWMTIDPINLIKLVTLTSAGFAIGALLLFNSTRALLVQHRLVLVLSVFFALQLTLVFLFSGIDKSSQFFGTMGRNTGLLCYLSLLMVLIGAVASSNSILYRKIIGAAVATGAISGLYGVIQFYGVDPIGWANKYSPVIGFLGNPNFQSSLLGMSAIAGLVILIDASVHVSRRLLSLFVLLVSLFVATVSNSQQGLLVFALGSVVLVFFKIKSFKKPLLTTSYFLTVIAASCLSVLGFLNKGFLSGYLYQASVTYRGDYWRAGWNMALENPLFGVGLDSYGDNYRKYRTIEAILRRGPEIVSNAAHNIFIDFAANAGIPLLAIYLGFMLFAVRKILIYIQSEVRDIYFEGIIAVWIGYTAQSLISINQIGLAVWGWALTGLIIGWKQNSDIPIETKIYMKNSKNKKEAPVLSPKNLLTLISGLAVGLVLSIPPLVASSQVKSALATSQLETVLKAERSWPRDPARSNQIAVLLVSNKLEKDALRIARATTNQFPMNFDAWKVLSEIPATPKEEKTLALSNMQKLDPLNPTLK
jgi:O-antigen ligase